MNKKNINEIINIAADAGKIMLESGGETYRVEETIEKISNSFGFMECESYVTPTGIMITIIDDNGNNVSILKRVVFRTLNLEKISQINDLSRKISANSISTEEVKKELKIINESKGYNNYILILFAAISSSFFTLIFGGNFYDFLVAFIIGAIIKLISLKLNSLKKINDFFINIICGAVTATLASISVYFNIGTNLGKIISGSIMLLVPGLAITNAIRDTIEGNLVSGMARALEAFLTAVAIAVGTGIALKFWFIYLGGITI